MKLGERRSEVLFAAGNAVPALVLLVGLFALPVRWWPADLVVGACVLAVLGASGVAVARPPLSRAALRLGAKVLLGIGLVIIAAAALSLAFLSGIHGDFGRGGVTLMVLVLLLVLPYAVVYPAIQLLWLGPGAERPRATAKPKPGDLPPAEPKAALESSPTPAAEVPAGGGDAPAGDGGATA